MRPRSLGISLLSGLLLSSCVFLLDFDELQEGAPDAGADVGTAGTDGAATDGAADAGFAGSAGSFSGIGLDEAPQVVAEAVCAKLEECAGRETLQLFLFDEDCRVLLERIFANGIIANIAQSLQNNTVTYNPEALPACAASYRALSCEDVSLSFPEECKQALGGLQGENQACAHSLECAEGLFCQIAACPGTCVPFLPLDAACTEGDTCAPGSTCFENTCRPLGGEGAACGGGTLPDCLTGFLCVGDNDAEGQTGHCFAANKLFVLNENQNCTFFGDPPALCVEGLSCPFAFGSTCVAEAEAGGTCQVAVPDMCPTGEYCNQSTCTALPGVGEACAFALLNPPCSAYLRCVAGICRPLGDNGNACARNEECYSGLCLEGRCVPPSCQE